MLSNEEYSKTDVICLTETFLNDEVLTSEVSGAIAEAAQEEEVAVSTLKTTFLQS
jgi:hypothetical protein